MSDLPRLAVETDHRLESATESASEALAKHRWHWTLDESNPERVSLRAYAAAVGRSHTTIQRSAQGYLVMVGTGARATDAIARAQMGAETQAATEAVAEARGVKFDSARRTRPTETRRVRDMARERAERHGTSVEEEAPKVAQSIVRSERVEQRTRDERRERLGLRFVQMEGKLAKAKSALLDALDVARDVEWEAEHRELLEHTLEGVKSLLSLVDLALTGAADIDWDAELAGLEQAQ